MPCWFFPFFSHLFCEYSNGAILSIKYWVKDNHHFCLILCRYDAFFKIILSMNITKMRENQEHEEIAKGHFEARGKTIF